MFEVVLDYGEHDADAPTPNDAGAWLCRNDPFSVYRAGFEVRTYRLCQRVLVFHHFPREAGVGADCLVRSVDLEYRESRGIAADRRLGNPVASFIASVTQRGYTRNKEADTTARRTHRSASSTPTQSSARLLEQSTPTASRTSRPASLIPRPS